jgi:hypothetical protein
VPARLLARVDEALDGPADVAVGRGRCHTDFGAWRSSFSRCVAARMPSAYIRSCFLLRTYEYLAAGKPVIATGPDFAATMNASFGHRADPPGDSTFHSLTRNLRREGARPGRNSPELVAPLRGGYPQRP